MEVAESLSIRRVLWKITVTRLMKGQMPPVSIILPVYNQELTIEQCIKSLLAQDYPRKELIIVDDGSTDKTPEIASKYPAKLIVLKHGHRPRALNRALKTTKGEIIAIVEGDAIYDQRYLSRCVEHFKDQRVGGVIGKLYTLNPESMVARCIEVYRRVRWDLIQKPYTAWVYRKTTLEAIGGFDEDLYIADDAAVGIQMVKSNYKIVFEPSAILWHREPESLLSYLKKQFRWGVGTLPFLAKYYRSDLSNPHIWKRTRDLLTFLSVIPLSIFILLTGKFTYIGCLAILAIVLLIVPVYRFYARARKVSKDSIASMLFPLLDLSGKFAFFLGFIWGLVLKLMRRNLLKYT